MFHQLLSRTFSLLLYTLQPWFRPFHVATWCRIDSDPVIRGQGSQRPGVQACSTICKSSNVSQIADSFWTVSPSLKQRFLIEWSEPNHCLCSKRMQGGAVKTLPTRSLPGVGKGKVSIVNNRETIPRGI